MRTLAFLLLLTGSLAAATIDDRPLPSTVSYLLGGVVSGPYRLTVDLETGRLSEAKPPPGVHGDGARVSAADLSETARRALTPAERNTFRVLAAPVWRDGAARRGCLEFSMDALVQLAITAGGVERRSDAPAQCLTPDAVALRRALLCAADPVTGCS
ncbi:hypothetical protein D9599_19230 [Roseomonas sp. KE2513]|nr:hypothetical protein [Roseomonas sp. KE2513]